MHNVLYNLCIYKHNNKDLCYNVYYSTNICFAVRVKAPNDLKLSKIELIVYNKVDYTFR